MDRPFYDRFDAGKQLAARLQSSHSQEPNLLILALPRGGIPVGYEVANVLQAPLDVFMVRKIGVPGHEELAMGAIATGNVGIINHHVVQRLKIPQGTVEAVTEKEEKELHRREEMYRHKRPPPDVRDKTVILVDDGLATGMTMEAAVATLKGQGPRRIVVAVPVAPPDTLRRLKSDVDDIICLVTAERFYAVGLFYENFSQVNDKEVRSLLEQAEEELPQAPGSGSTPAFTQDPDITDESR